MTISPSSVGELECNGIVEHFIRTLEEQCLCLHQFATPAEAREVIAAFIRRYDSESPVERLGYRTPSAAATTQNRRVDVTLVFPASVRGT